MNRVAWWLIERMSRLLEPNEREAVLGDFAEAGESATAALLDLAGLLIRRRLAPWGERLLCSLGGVAVAATICFFLMNHIYGYVARSLTDILAATSVLDHLYYATPVNPFDLHIKLSCVCGLFVASPYILWQLWLLFAPGSYRGEKRHAWLFVLLASALFLIGGFIGYEGALPAALRVLLDFASRSKEGIAINEVWNLALAIVVGTALLSELPSLCWLIYLKRRRA
jgi:sec-independent protein translocase protein TatC